MNVPGLERRLVATREVRLSVALAGPEEGPLVVLLHGFPEFWYGWRHQIGPLAAAGYRVAVPDQRGYNESDKPLCLESYTRDVLAEDVVRLIERLGHDRAVLVGHDWGGAVAWWTALKHPERVEALAALNIPHPAVFAKAVKGPRQALRSWYIAAFQLPGLPERLLARRGAKALLEILRSHCAEGALDEDDLARYREAFLKPGALTSMLAWYRAAAQLPTAPLPGEEVAAPTLVVWGEKDRSLGKEMAEPSAALCADGRVVFVPEAGHFVALDAPERVTELLLDFLGPAESRASCAPRAGAA